MQEPASGRHRPPPFYTTAEVAAICDATQVAVNEWIREGKLPAYRPPRGHYRVARHDLIEFLEASGRPVPPEMDDRGRFLVLVVDDEPMVRAVVANILESAGDMEVATAADGFEAGRLAAELCPAVVVLDLRMPGLDGATLCQRIKNDPRTSATRVLVLTGHNDPDNLALIRKCQADGVIPKPFVVKDLLDAVRDLARAAHPRRPRPLLVSTGPPGRPTDDALSAE